ncbi:MAG: helix-turn-helix domain-containing protein [Pseudomonadota bacterium]
MTVQTLFTENAAFRKLPPQAQKVMRFAAQNGSISTREAFIDLDIGQGSLTKKVTQIGRAGFRVVRERRQHPVTGRQYTRYFFHDGVLEGAAA